MVTNSASTTPAAAASKPVVTAAPATVAVPAFVAAKPLTTPAPLKAEVTKPVAKKAASSKTTAKKSPIAKTVPVKPPVVKKAAVKKTPVKRPLPKAFAPAKAEKTVKGKKPKLVRDSFTIPKAEYVVLEELKQRGARLTRPVKKSELLRAGIKALLAMSDAAFLTALQQVPTIKTGRPALKN